jgi:hypothetical protein
MVIDSTEAALAFIPQTFRVCSVNGLLFHESVPQAGSDMISSEAMQGCISDGLRLGVIN